MRNSTSIIYNKPLQASVYFDCGPLGEKEFVVDYRIWPAEPDVGVDKDGAEIEVVVMDGNEILLPDSMLDEIATDLLSSAYWGD